MDAVGEKDKRVPKDPGCGWSGKKLIRLPGFPRMGVSARAAGAAA